MSGLVGTTSSKSKVLGRPHDTAKAWARIQGNTPVVQESFNVKAFSNPSTGVYKLDFNAPMKNGNYCVVVSSAIHMEFIGTTNAGDVTVEIRNNSNNAVATDKITVLVFSK
tara:strand:- start:386 stop:718 length:333 start_codon:yes stop_codon:yes gene_type:complete